MFILQLRIIIKDYRNVFIDFEILKKYFSKTKIIKCKDYEYQLHWNMPSERWSWAVQATLYNIYSLNVCIADALC